MFRLLDRYILRQILLTFIFTLIAFCIIFIIVNFMEKMDDFMDAKVKIGIIIQYYLVFLPDILKILMPVSILVACLFTVGKLSNNNEIIAMKSGGMGLYRLIIPIATIGIILSVGQYYFNGWVVPYANAEKTRVSQVHLKKGFYDNTINNLAFRDNPMRNVLIQYYDPIAKKGFQTNIEDFVKDTTSNSGLLNKAELYKLKTSIEAKSIVWNDTIKNWILEEVVMREIVSNECINTTRMETMPIELNTNYKQLEKLNKKVNEMNFDELKEYINFLKLGGKDIRKMEIEYYSAQALPLANFIVILFAVSFASVKKRNGLAVQIAAAMVIVFTYLIFFEISKPIGLALKMPPQLVGWSANIIFVICGIVSIVKTRS